MGIKILDIVGSNITWDPSTMNIPLGKEFRAVVIGGGAGGQTTNASNTYGYGGESGQIIHTVFPNQGVITYTIGTGGSASSTGGVGGNTTLTTGSTTIIAIGGRAISLSPSTTNSNVGGGAGGYLPGLEEFGGKANSYNLITMGDNSTTSVKTTFREQNKLAGGSSIIYYSHNYGNYANMVVSTGSPQITRAIPGAGGTKGGVGYGAGGGGGSGASGTGGSGAYGAIILFWD